MDPKPLKTTKNLINMESKTEPRVQNSKRTAKNSIIIEESFRKRTVKNRNK
jgi:hypothetical protein